MSFDVVFTKSAEVAAETWGALPELEERARGALADLPGKELSALRKRLFHSFALDDGTEVICSLMADGNVRVDTCALAEP